MTGRPKRSVGVEARRAALIRRYLPAAAALVFLLGALYRFDGKLSMNGDDAEFLILGRAIAAGKGMVNLNETVPTPHTKYPFFFPAILALLQLAAPGSILAPKIAVLLLGAGAASLFALLLLRVTGPGIAAASALLYATNPFLLEFSHQILSETPYLFLSLLALVLYLRWEEKGGGALFGSAAAAALAAYFTRTAGIALVGGVLLSLLSARRFRLAILFAAVFLVAATPWALRNRAAGGGGDYLAQFLVKDPYNPEAGKLTLGHFFGTRIAGNIRTYGTFEIGRGILAAPFAGKSIGEAGAARILAALLALLAAAGLLREAGRRRGILEIYTILSLGVCLIWPEVWGSIRFLLPILPLLLLYTMRQGSELLGRAAPGVRKAAAACLVLLLLVSNAYANFVEKPLSSYPPAWRNYAAAAAWVRDNTPEESVVACRKPGLFYVWSGRRSVVYLWSENREEVFRKLLADKVTYVVVAPLSATTPRYLIPAINEHRDRFEIVYQLSNPETYILRLKGEGER